MIGVCKDAFRFVIFCLAIASTRPFGLSSIKQQMSQKVSNSIDTVSKIGKEGRNLMTNLFLASTLLVGSSLPAAALTDDQLLVLDVWKEVHNYLSNCFGFTIKASSR